MKSCFYRECSSHGEKIYNVHVNYQSAALSFDLALIRLFNNIALLCCIVSRRPSSRDYYPMIARSVFVKKQLDAALVDNFGVKQAFSEKELRLNIAKLIIFCQY